MKYLLNIHANGGYSADQVQSVTVGDLRGRYHDYESLQNHFMNNYYKELTDETNI